MSRLTFKTAIAVWWAFAILILALLALFSPTLASAATPLPSPTPAQAKTFLDENLVQLPGAGINAQTLNQILTTIINVFGPGTTTLVPGTTPVVCSTAGAILYSSGSVLGCAGSVVTPNSGQFYTQNGANIQRFNDRVFIGGATPNDGAFPNVTKDWVTTALLALTPGHPGTPQVSISNIFTQDNASSADGGVALTLASQNKWATSAGYTAISNSCVTFSNNTTYAARAYCNYTEFYRTQAVSGSAIGHEIDGIAYVAGQAADPFRQGVTIAHQIASGGERTPGFDTDAGVQFVNNTQRFGTGIVFGSTSLVETSNKADAIIMASYGDGAALGHSLVWKSGNAGTPGTERWRLYSNASSGTGALVLGAGVASMTGADLNVGGANANGIGVARGLVIESATGSAGLELIANNVLGGYFTSDGANYTAIASGAWDFYLQRSGATKLQLGASAVTVTDNLTISGIPGAAGAGGLYVCIDTTGVLYKKAACP